MHATQPRCARRTNLLWIAGILILAVGVRLHQLGAPLADNLQAKQTYSSNKARNIARAPFDPMRLSLDVLDQAGRPMQLAEEVPVYIGLVAATFAAWGETEVWGRLLSIAGSLVAILAFFDLTRREHGAQTARIATFVFALAPLFIFYGRAVMPDAWMLAAMLASAAGYRRYLDSNRLRWLAVAAVCGALAVLFKYWGLMIIWVLADMARCARGWRGWVRADFLLLMAAVVLPTAAWLVLVFVPAPNPVQNGWVAGAPPSPYLVVQQPGVLGNRALYSAFLSRFLVRDCGPVATALMALGVWAAVRRRAWLKFDGAALTRWTVMGCLFFVLLAPKLIDHDYYELMMLPAAAVWASLGWQACSALLERRAAPRWRRAALAVCVLAGLAIVHSPWVSGGLFALDVGKVALGRALAQICPERVRVVAISPAIAMIVPVHYSQREGWTVRATTLPCDWPAQVTQWHAQGAGAIGVYFDAKTKPRERLSYQPLIDALPVVRHESGGMGLGRYEYFVLRLSDLDVALGEAIGTGSTRR